MLRQPWSARQCRHAGDKAAPSAWNWLSLHPYCSFLVGLVVFRLFRSPRGIRDDGRSLGNPSKIYFSPLMGRAVRRKGCAVLGSIVGCCQHQARGVPSRAGTPLPAPGCLYPAACTQLPAPCQMPELPPQQSAALGNNSVCICLQPAHCCLWVINASLSPLVCLSEFPGLLCWECWAWLMFST